ncbi:hypothetical protein KC340_g16848 [Hortaea werneckii]|nr:hypothetical protein KC342_g17167 [Hortaea werneckii]KAI7058769.1 hypothetical protein KC339_g17551 [Hortaea werneckii]KAI7292104.1 hypothetical protein KC340_g16848 [Hortaea werneckii]KAI7377014.1 hypothetical protein KC328_g14623 [Hortaea werneckii]KAI7466589.1 hypothetical protein KC351_g14427 [Hortaea werneckii]
MPAVTRSMASSNTRQDRTAGGATSSKPGSGASGSRHTGQRLPTNVSGGPVRQVSDDEESDNDSEDTDESDEESSDDETNPTRDLVNRIMTVFDPYGQLAPHEFAQINGGSDESSIKTFRLARLLETLVGSDRARLHLLRSIVSPGTEWWSKRLLSNMQRRYSSILTRLQVNIQNPATGAGIPETIDYLRVLFYAIDGIRADHFESMNQTEQLEFLDILISAFNRLIDDTDQYASTPTPPYAGQGFQSHRRLFSSLIAERGHPQYFIETLRHFGRRLLRARQTAIQGICARATQLLTQQLQNSPDQARLTRVRQALQALHAAT